jgi:hypothetical protein
MADPSNPRRRPSSSQSLSQPDDGPAVVLNDDEIAAELASLKRQERIATLEREERRRSRAGSSILLQAQQVKREASVVDERGKKKVKREEVEQVEREKGRKKGKKPIVIDLCDSDRGGYRAGGVLYTGAPSPHVFSVPSTKRFFLPGFPSFSLFSPSSHCNFVLFVSCSVETHSNSEIRSSPSGMADEGESPKGKREKKEEKSRLQVLSSRTLRPLYSTLLSWDGAKTPLAHLTSKQPVTSSRLLLSRCYSFNNTLSSPVRPRE